MTVALPLPLLSIFVEPRYQDHDSTTPLGGRLDHRPFKRFYSHPGCPSSISLMTTFQQVRQLLDLITKSVDTLEQACAGSGTDIPSLDEPFHPAQMAFWANPATAGALAVIGAASSHLGAIATAPHVVMHQSLGGVSLINVSIREITQSNQVLEIGCHPHVLRRERN
jgi:hypothetical protein